MLRLIKNSIHENEGLNTWKYLENINKMENNCEVFLSENMFKLTSGLRVAKSAYSLKILK